MIDSEKLIKFFDALYLEDCEVEETKKGIQEDLKSFAENNEINPKAIKSAFTLYKRYKSGKNTAEDCNDYMEMSNIIDSFFSTEEQGN